MELRQFECFVAVAEEAHFGRAAQRLYVGQPTVSHQIRRLERELGATLFERTSRQVRLTKAGERLLPQARAVLAAAEAARCSVLEGRERARRTLRLGTCSGLGEHLHRVLNSLAALKPDIAVDLVSTPADARAEAIASGRLDAALTHGHQQAASGVDCLDLWLDPLVAAVPGRHPLAARSEISLGELADLPLRLLPRRGNPVLVDCVMNACAAAGFTPCAEQPSTSLDEMLAAIGSSAASWTVLHASQARLLTNRYVAFRPFRGPRLEIRTMLLLPHGKRTEEASALVQACRMAV